MPRELVMMDDESYRATISSCGVLVLPPAFA